MSRSGKRITKTSKNSNKILQTDKDSKAMGNMLEKWLNSNEKPLHEGNTATSSNKLRKRKSETSDKQIKNPLKTRKEHELSPSPISSGKSGYNSSDTDEFNSDDSQEAQYWKSNWQKSETEKLKDRLRLVSQWSKKDTKEYREQYPGKRDMRELQQNYLFYTNQQPSKPDGDFIEDILENWKGDYYKLERHHGYIQWLFPIREPGMNWHCQELQLHEAQEIQKDEKAKERFLKAYELMLDFYGLQLKDKKTGQLERAENWQTRLDHLNRSYHNYLRITRILKSMGELGFEHMKYPMVSFLLHEAINERTISNAARSCVEYWAQTLRNDQERSQILQNVNDFLKSDASSYDSGSTSTHQFKAENVSPGNEAGTDSSQDSSQWNLGSSLQSQGENMSSQSPASSHKDSSQSTTSEQKCPLTSTVTPQENSNQSDTVKSVMSEQSPTTFNKSQAQTCDTYDISSQQNSQTDNRQQDRCEGDEKQSLSIAESSAVATTDVKSVTLELISKTDLKPLDHGVELSNDNISIVESGISELSSKKDLEPVSFISNDNTSTVSNVTNNLTEPEPDKRVTRSQIKKT